MDKDKKQKDLIAKEQVDDYLEKPVDDYIKRALQEGYEIITPKENELLIDIDSESDYETFLRNSEIVESKLTIVLSIEFKDSPSGLPHRHIYVRFPFNLTNLQRVAWQACLGSDRTRETLSMFRILNGEEYVTILKEKKG